MRIGICSSDFDASDTDGLFAKMRNLGFASTQLAFSSVGEIMETGFVPTGQIEIPGKVKPDIIDRVRKSAEFHKIEIMAVNGTFNMAHPDESVRSEGISRFRNHAEAVSNLGVKYISLCSGTRFKDYLWSYHQDNSTPEAWSDMVDCVKRCVDSAEKHGVVLAVETEASNIVDTPEKARKMMDEVGSPNLKMIMDCANLFHGGEAKRENVRRIVKHAFDVFGDDVVIAHGKDLCESLKSDEIRFCPTGEGILDFNQFIDLLNEHNYRGDMLLHGIYDESKMPAGYETVNKILKYKNI
jgi:sugar phosphate isomerase/epimerase